MSLGSLTVQRQEETPFQEMIMIQDYHDMMLKQTIITTSLTRSRIHLQRLDQAPSPWILIQLYFRASSAVPYNICGCSNLE